MNFVLHSDIVSFLQAAMVGNLEGIYNITSSQPITLHEIVQWLDKPKVQFGAYTYEAGNIDNGKAVQILPDLDRSSKSVIEEFIQEWKHG